LKSSRVLDEGGFGNEHPRGAIGEHPGVFRRRKTPIQGNEHRPEPRTRKEQDQQNGIVEPEERNPVPFPDAELRKNRRSPLDALGEIRVRQVGAVKPKRRLLRRERRVSLDPV
jgi:hypothetical protein